MSNGSYTQDDPQTKFWNFVLLDQLRSQWISLSVFIASIIGHNTECNSYEMYRKNWIQEFQDPGQFNPINCHTFGIPIKIKTVSIYKIHEPLLTDPLRRGMRRKRNEENSRWWWGRKFVFGGFVTATRSWLQPPPTLHKRWILRQMNSERCKKRVYNNSVVIGIGKVSITTYLNLTIQ